MAAELSTVVDAITNEINRQVDAPGPGPSLYGGDDPTRFGMDGEFDLVAIASAAVDALERHRPLPSPAYPISTVPVHAVRFRGKPLDELTREEALEALKQALMRVADLEGRRLTIDPLGMVEVGP